MQNLTLSNFSRWLRLIRFINWLCEVEFNVDKLVEMFIYSILDCILQVCSGSSYFSVIDFLIFELENTFLSFDLSNYEWSKLFSFLSLVCLSICALMKENSVWNSKNQLKFTLALLMQFWYLGIRDIWMMKRNSKWAFVSFAGVRSCAKMFLISIFLVICWYHWIPNQNRTF